LVTLTGDDLDDPDFRLCVLSVFQERAQAARPLELVGSPMGLKLVRRNSGQCFRVDRPGV
jgi:hypothetical protein